MSTIDVIYNMLQFMWKFCTDTLAYSLDDTPLTPLDQFIAQVAQKFVNDEKINFQAEHHKILDSFQCVFEKIPPLMVAIINKNNHKECPFNHKECPFVDERENFIHKIYSFQDENIVERNSIHYTIRKNVPKLKQEHIVEIDVFFMKMYSFIKKQSEPLKAHIRKFLTEENIDTCLDNTPMSEKNTIREATKAPAKKERIIQIILEKKIIFPVQEKIYEEIIQSYKFAEALISVKNLTQNIRRIPALEPLAPTVLPLLARMNQGLSAADWCFALLASVVAIVFYYEGRKSCKETCGPNGKSVALCKPNESTTPTDELPLNTL